jgi:hypothetical protein
MEANFPLNAETARALRDGFKQDQKFRRSYDYTRRIVCLAGQQGTAEIPMPSEGDFQVLGYNLEYEVQPNGLESLFIRMRQQDGSRAWSNDLLPVRSIATPGARIAGQPGIRYGYRQFVAYIPKNDLLTIDWDNSDGLVDLEMWITFTGNIYPVYG